MQMVVGGLLTTYELGGNGVTTLLVLHGWGGSLTEWKFVIREWGDKYRIVLVDLPGFGGTQRPNVVWGVDEYADWVEEVIKRLKVGKLVVVGHSFGGRVALVLASRGVKIQRLVLIDAAGMELKSLKVRVLAKLAPLFRWVPESMKNVLRAEDYKTSGEMREIYKKVVSQNLRGVLNKITADTLILWGEKDEILSFDEARMLREGMDNSKLRVVWGADHWPHVKKQAELVKILKEEGI